MGLTGDFATLRRMRQRLAATPGATERAAIIAAPELQEATMATFADEANPSGTPWKADKPKTYALGTKSILDRSGALRGSIAVAAVGAAIRLAVGAVYYRFQRGKRDPIPTKKITKRWGERIRAACFRSMKEILGK